MADPMSDERLAEIRAEVERLTDKAAKPNPWPVDNEAHPMTDGWKRGTENALERTARPLLAEVERLRAELAKPVGDEEVWLTLRILKAGDGTRRNGELLERAIRQAETERDEAREQVKRALNLLPEIDATFRRLCERLSIEDQEALAEVYMALRHNLGALDGTEGTP